MPSQVRGLGLSTVDTNTAGTLLPQLSVTTGVAGATASERHSTVDEPSAGTTGGIEGIIVRV